MNRSHLIGTCFLLLFLLLTACTQHELPTGKEQEKEKEAQLSFCLSLPEAVADSRGVVTDYPDTPTAWTEWEKVVDGRHLYHVAVFLVDESGEVVGKDVTLSGNSDNTIATDSLTATVTFTEGLSYGNYTLYAIANYSAYSSDGKSYNGLSLSGFTANATTFNELLNYTLDAGEDRICSQVPQPLTLMKQIELHPGVNQISGELIRTYARIRIEIRNQSAVSDLTVNSLSFSNQFAKRTAKLFEENATNDDRGTLDITSGDALQPFEETVTIEKMTVSSSETIVNDIAVFDAYILESKETDENVDYTYTLGVSYGEASNSTYKIESTTAITDPDNLSEGHYLIHNNNNNRQRYLMAGTNSVGIGTGVTLNKGEEVAPEYVWELEKYGTNQYYLKYTNEQGTSYYIDNPSSTSIPLVSEKDTYFTFTANNGINMQSSKEVYVGSYWGPFSYYIAIKRDGWNYYAGGDDELGSGTRFRFYKVGKGGLSKTETIVLNTINPETAKVEAVREIKRNDFINVLVTVTYNEETGDFEFDVNDWETGGGNVEFN